MYGGGEMRLAKIRTDVSEIAAAKSEKWNKNSHFDSWGEMGRKVLLKNSIHVFCIIYGTW